jgi:D-threo-aldose 1-dehydrogenase
MSDGPARATQRVRLGRTDVEVTRLGLGTAPLGGWPEATDPAVADATIQAAWDAGIRFFDTAPLYGHGLSETWLGQKLSKLPRDEFAVATKIGRLLRAVDPEEPSLFHGTPPVNPIYDFSYDGTVRSYDESLDRLGLDSVDIAHIHDPDDHYDEALDGARRALRDLKAAGRIRAVSAGMNQAEMLTDFARTGDFDCFLLAGRYTLLEQGALDNLLPACRERGISVITGGVFNSGVLIDPDRQAYYNYADAAPEIVERARRIGAICARHDVPVKAAALQFPLGHPAVACVLTGARTPAELEENVALFDLPIPPALWDDLKRERLLRDDAPVPEEI